MKDRKMVACFPTPLHKRKNIAIYIVDFENKYIETSEERPHWELDVWSLWRGWSHLRGFLSYSLYITIIHLTMTELKNNHVTMNFTMIMSQFAWPFLPVVDP